MYIREAHARHPYAASLRSVYSRAPGMLESRVKGSYVSRRNITPSSTHSGVRLNAVLGDREVGLTVMDCRTATGNAMLPQVLRQPGRKSIYLPVHLPIAMQ